MDRVKVFVSCPGDLKAEKSIVEYLCNEINQKYQNKSDVSLLMVDWEKSVIPQFGQRPQAIINEQIGEYDVFVGILWKRFGTPTGAKNPNTGKDYESGTVEEFEIAYQRWKQRKRPLINFYFKEQNCKGSIDDQEQIAKVEAFRERLRSHYKGWVVDFHDEIEFERQVRRFLENVVWQLDEDTSSQTYEQVTQALKKVRLDEYKCIRYYIPRKVVPARRQNDDESLFVKHAFSKDLHELSKKTSRIALIGDAGSGKTIELQQLACKLLNDNQSYYPFYLSLSKYTNQNISDLLPVDWDKVPQNRFFVILDGLDEIESTNRKSAFRQIELFVDTYPQAHVIVSCRTNFYKTETEQSSGTLKTFSTHRLHELDPEEIEKHIEDRFANRAPEFTKTVLQHQLQDLLKIPFYLTHLSELYESNGLLPQSKSALFEQLLIARIKLDEEHYRTTIILGEERRAIIRALEHLAIGMETLGRNFITNDEFQQLIEDKVLRDLTKYCTAWKKNEQDATWQFEHNNFQEYLAAKVLACQSLELTKEFIAFEPEYLRIIPSWVNTLSFLLSISTNSDLLDWVLENESELVVRFEPDKIDLEKRIQIFKEIFNAYKAKQIWINRDKFKFSELARFGQADETIDFLRTEIDKAVHYTTVTNGIELLGHFEIPFAKKEQIEKFLLEYALNDDNEELVQQRAVMALTNLKLISPQGCRKIVDKCRESDSDRIRYALYYFLYNGDYLDQNIDVFLQGIKYLRFMISSDRSESRLIDEGWHLRIGLEKATSTEAIRKILTYFIDHPRNLHSALLEKAVPTIAENAGRAYAKDSSLLELSLELFVVLVREHFEEETRHFRIFFDKTDTRLEAFKQLLKEEKKTNDCFVALATVADSRCIDYFCTKYSDKDITDEDVLSLENSLMWKNHDLFLTFNKRINELSNNKFMLPAKRDYEKEGKERNQRDFDLLFDEAEFLQQIKLLFETEQKETLTAEELTQIETEHWDNPYFSELALGALQDRAREQIVTKDAALKPIGQDNWGWFCIQKIYEKMKNKVDIDLSDEHKDWISNWCESNLTRVNFRAALITKGDGSFSTSAIALILSYFLKKLGLEFPKTVLLDMLSFYWPDGESTGFEFLEKRLLKSDLTERILENLSSGIENDFVLQNHIAYCKRHRIEEVLHFAFDEIRSTKRSIDTRRLALETVLRISNRLDVVEQLLPKIEDDFRWEIVDKLVKYESIHIHTILKNLLEGKVRKDKLRAAEYLIGLQDIDGLKYYCNWIRRHNKFPTNIHDKSPLQHLKSMDVIPNLIQLLRLSYVKKITEDSFNSLRQNVLAGLTKIAIQSEQNYFGVRKVIISFIKNHSAKYEDVNFLYSFLEGLEQEFYAARSEQLDINDVLKKLKQIN